MNVYTCPRCGCVIGDRTLHETLCIPESPEQRLKRYEESGFISRRGWTEAPCWIPECTSGKSSLWVSGRGVMLCDDCALDPANHDLHVRDL